MPTDAKALVQTAVKNGPKIVAALGALGVFMKKNPRISTWLQEQLDDIPKRIIAAQKERGDAARIRGMLGIIRDVAREWGAHEGEQSTADEGVWLRHADDIELGARLAEQQPRPDQKKTLARLRAETEGLLADLLETIARDRSLPSSGPPEDAAQAR